MMNQQTGKDSKLETKTGSCHCGSVVFEVALKNGFEDIRHCNCSFCKRRSAYVASVPVSGLKVIKGKDQLTLYQWGTKTAKHYFCSKCGIYTHHQRRSNPQEFGLNIACIEGVDPFSYGSVPVYDGANHEKDTGIASDKKYY